MVPVVGDNKVIQGRILISLVLHLQQHMDIPGLILSNLELVNLVVQDLALQFVIIQVRVHHDRQHRWRDGNPLFVIDQPTGTAHDFPETARLPATSTVTRFDVCHVTYMITQEREGIVLQVRRRHITDLTIRKDVSGLVGDLNDA